MTLQSEVDTVREAVGVFDSHDRMQAAIDELLISGFDRAELSLLASEKAAEEKLGGRYKRVTELEDDSRAPRTVYVDTESRGGAAGGLIGGLMYVGGVVAVGAVAASGGTLAAIVGAAALAGGAGALIGSLLAGWIGDRHARYIQEQLDRGGLLLWVRTWDAEKEKRAVEIMSRHSGRDVHVHTLPARTEAS
ncbi:MAG: hypothetical protein AB7P52_10900 [Alphaproteobacteria bacterium]